MSLGAQIEGFLRQASLTAKHKLKIAESIRLQAIIITPEKQITAIGVELFTEVADFIRSRRETLAIRLRHQPGVYFDHIVPFRDYLTIQVVADTEDERLVREFTAIPMVDRDLRAEGQLSTASNLKAYDNVSFSSYEFQLMDRGFAKLRNIPISDNYLMANPGEVLSLVLDNITKEVDFGSAPKYKGLYMHKPVDNINNYPQVTIPYGTRLVDLPLILQNHNEYGIYSKGLGAFYKQNYWWVYPLFNTNLADTHHRPIDIIRVPQDKIPSLDYTFYKSDVSLTIIATGEAYQTDGADIRKQTKGVGKRIIMGSAIAGETGYNYKNGRGVITRADTMQEYKLSDRRSGDEYIPVDHEPTGNTCAALSLNAMNEGEMVEVEWHNGDTGYLEPGHPLRYQYLGENNTMIVRRGVLLGYRTDFKPVQNGPAPQFKRTCVLQLFLKRQARYNSDQ